MRLLLPLLLATSVLLGSRTSLAQDTAPSDEVQTELASAIREYDSHNYQEAYALFLRVHEARPSARSERALGNTAFELRHYIEAVHWFELSLGDTRNPLTDEMRTDLEGLVVRARSFIGHYTLRANVEGAIIAIDGQPLQSPTTDLDLGSHELTVRADGYETDTRTITVRGGETETIEVTLLRAGVAAPDPGGTFRDFGWASIVTGGALVVGGIIATVIWANSVNTLNANIEGHACVIDPATESVLPSSQPPCFDQQNRYRLAGPLAIAGYAAGVVFIGVGVGLVLGAPSAESDTTAFSCSPFGEVGVSCRGSF